MSGKNQFASLLALMGPVVALTAHAEVYLTESQAANIFFPNQLFQKTTVRITDEEAEKIEKLSDQKVRNKTLNVLKSKEGSVVFVDQVLGKHEYITFAVGLNKNGQVQGIEILEYRESYGQQIRREPWRKQFAGKDKSSPLKLDEDIKNISGATLSSSHVTGGVRRLLQTYELVKSRL